MFTEIVRIIDFESVYLGILLTMAGLTSPLTISPLLPVGNGSN